MTAPASFTTALAGRYALERELGRGGMATVYLAQDLKHQRRVAIKVLKPELAAALGPERFLREIAIAAPLNHPHILPLLDSGEAAGFLYYVMPYVEGESLRDRLTREKQLPLGDALQIAREVADALSYAHSHDVVHRDIKPENILLESGHAVVADFGIARAITAAGSERLTETGIAVGTSAYMSPEQAVGSQELDGRSDLYSLGCVLYEMLSGETPYTGPTPQAILAKKLSEPLPRISVVRGAVPAGIGAALTKVLAGTPADRHLNAADFAAALARPEVMVTPSASTQTWPDRVRKRLPRWVAGVAGLAAVALLVSQLPKSKPLNITISDITPVTTEPGVEFQPAISPDGKEVAYVAGAIGAPHLVIRKTANVAGGGEARPADSSLLREWYPSWSPDGDFVRFLACRAAGCAWNETGSLGGAVRSIALPQRVLTRAVDFPGLTAQGDPCVAWAPDGARVAFVVADTIFTVSTADTASRRIMVHRSRYSALHSLVWSPDGKLIAYVNGNPLWRASGNVARSSIWIVDVSGGEPQRVTT
ncbi:MAG TPA: protein kinase, partial [Gemmatimonadales bacterium]